MKFLLLMNQKDKIKNIFKSDIDKLIFCNNELELLNEYKKNLYDSIFIDLEFIDYKGIEILKKIRIYEKEFNKKETLVFLIESEEFEIDIIDKLSKQSEKFLNISNINKKEILNIINNYKNN